MSAAPSIKIGGWSGGSSTKLDSNCFLWPASCVRLQDLHSAACQRLGKRKRDVSTPSPLSLSQTASVPTQHSFTVCGQKNAEMHSRKRETRAAGTKWRRRPTDDGVDCSNGARALGAGRALNFMGRHRLGRQLTRPSPPPTAAATNKQSCIKEQLGRQGRREVHLLLIGADDAPSLTSRLSSFCLA